MSLLSSFITSHIIQALETQFVAYEPELQASFVAEIENFVSVVGQWVENKMTAKAAPAVAPEQVQPVVDPAQ